MKLNTMMLMVAVAALTFAVPGAAEHVEGDACSDDGPGYTTTEGAHELPVNGKLYYLMLDNDGLDSQIVLYQEDNNLQGLQRGSWDLDGQQQSDAVDDTCHGITRPDVRLLN